jgi:hypothetical protein
LLAFSPWFRLVSCFSKQQSRKTRSRQFLSVSRTNPVISCFVRVEESADLVKALAKALVPVLKGGGNDLDEAKVEAAIKDLLKNPAALIKSTVRVDALKRKTSGDALVTIFNVDHHLDAATEFFKKFGGFKRRTRAAVFGHKKQGKTQFLFFLTKLLQALGEGVVYLEPKATVKKLSFATEKPAEILQENLAIWRTDFEAFLAKTNNNHTQDVKNSCPRGPTFLRPLGPGMATSFLGFSNPNPNPTRTPQSCSNNSASPSPSSPKREPASG